MRTIVALTMFFAAQPGWAKGKDQGGRAGQVIAAEGQTSFEHGGKAHRLAMGYQLVDGDVLITGAAGKLKVLLDDDSMLHLGPNSRFELKQVAVKDGKREVSLKIVAGKFMAAVSQWFGPSTAWHVETPTAVAGVRGTVLWGDTGLDAICSLHGSVDVTSLTGGEETRVRLDEGSCASRMGQGKTEQLQPTVEQVQKYLGEVTIAR